MHRSLNVKPNKMDALMTSLSGGNQQKVLIGRLLLSEPGLLVLTEPTRGVDVATRREIYRMILEERNRGVAVLVVSSDIGDLVELADRVGVVEGGSMQKLAKRRRTKRTRNVAARLMMSAPSVGGANRVVC